MKILLIYQYFQQKGDAGGMRWNEMARIWAEQGAEITVISGMVHYSKGSKDEKYKRKYVFTENHAEKIKVIRTHVSDKYNRNYAGRIWAYISFAVSATFAGLFKAREKYDVILVSSPPLFVGIPAYIVAKIKKVPLVFEVRDLWPESAVATGVIKNKLIIRWAYAFEAFLYKHANLINVLTPAFKEELLKKNVPEQKIILIPNAADFNMSDTVLQTTNRRLLRQQLHIDDKLVIVYVGAHGVANHLIQILDTAEILRNTNAHFLLIGDGMQKKFLQEETLRRNLQDHITFLNSVSKPEALQYIIAADIGTSVLKKTDTFKTVYSNKTFDYMSCKKPVLMVIDGISKQLVEDAHAGLYVEPENPQMFSEKILYYLQNPAAITEHGNNGYAYAKKYFDREVLATQYKTHLQNLLDKNSK